MGNRFGLKDLLILVLLVALLISVWLAMQQFDRQWAAVQSIQTQLKDQAEQLRQLGQRPAAPAVAPATRPADAGAAGDDDDAATQPDGDQQASVDVDNGPFARFARALSQPDFATGDWLIDAFSSQINTLTPLVSSDRNASIVQAQVLETLGQLDPQTLTYTPLLAEGWEIEDNVEAFTAWRDEQAAEIEASLADDPAPLLAYIAEAGEDPAPGSLGALDPEERDRWIRRYIESELADAEGRPNPIVMRFTLREGLNFADGHPITADDVAFSFDWIMNPKIAAPRQRAYYGKMIESVEAVDDRTVVFRFKEPYFEALNLAAALEVLPEHIYAPMDPEAFNESKGLLFGSGPYRLPNPQGWEPSDQVVLVRNDRYWGLRPALDRLVFRLFTSDVPRLTAFRNQDIDLLSATPEQYTEMLEDPALVARTEHFEYMTPFNGYRYIGWNQELPGGGDPSIFADRRVRQAMTMLTDRPRLVDDVWLGFAEPASGPFNPLGDQNSPAVEPWPHDPDRAVSLLKEAGYTRSTRQTWTPHVLIVGAVAVAAAVGGLLLFGRIGPVVIAGAGALVLVTGGAAAALVPPIAYEGPLVHEETGEPFRFELTYPSGSANYRRMVLFLRDAYAEAGIQMEPNPLEFSVMIERLNTRDFEAITLGWTSGPETDIYQMFHSDLIGGGGDNFIAYRNPELDELVVEARRTIAPEQRMPMWRRAHEIMHADQPYTFLAWGKSLRFLDDRFENVERLRAGLNPRTEWYVPEPEQRWTR